MQFFHTLTPNTRGIIATCFAMLGFIGTDSCIKFASQDLPVGQMIAMRGVAILAILLAMAYATGAIKQMPTLKDRAVGIRAFGECMASLLYYNAIVQVPIANANAVLQTIPLAIVAAAALLFGEKVGWRRWLVILFGFCGVLLIVRPGAEGFQPEILWAVAAVVFFVIRDISTRKIDQGLPTVSINLVTSAAVMTMGFGLSVFEGWVVPSGQSILLLLLAACFLTMGYLAVTVAMRTGDISISSPFRYSIVLWAILIDAIVFGNRPDLLMIIGTVIIVGSGIYMIVRERQITKSRDVAHSSS